jgi:Family of unknown function (DUF6498)
MFEYRSYSPLLHIIYSNLLVMYGIWYEQWPIFPILFLIWCQEFVSTFFRYQSWRLVAANATSEADKEEAITNKKSQLVRYFMLSVYLIFIVVITIFLIHSLSDTDTLALNIRTLLFKNWLFDLTLILYTIQQAVSLNYFSKNPNKNYLQANILSPNMFAMHLGIIFGSISHFAAPKAYQPFVFALIFLGIKMAIELWYLSLNAKKSGNQV